MCRTMSGSLTEVELATLRELHTRAAAIVATVIGLMSPGPIPAGLAPSSNGAADSSTTFTVPSSHPKGRLAGIRGWRRLQRRADAELAFIAQLVSGGIRAKPDHLTGNNISHLAATVDVVTAAANVEAVEQSFSTKPGGAGAAAMVDVVAEAGLRWVKVTARGRDATARVVRGQGAFGQKSIVDSTAELVLT